MLVQKKKGFAASKVIHQFFFKKKKALSKMSDTTESSTIISELLEILHSWHRSEVRPKVLSMLLQLRQQQQVSSSSSSSSPTAATTTTSTLFFDTSSRIMASPQIAHDSELVFEIAQTLLAVATNSSSAPTMSFHTRHITAVISAIDNLRKTTPTPAKRTDDDGGSSCSKLVSLFKLVSHMLDRPSLQQHGSSSSSSSSSSQLDILPPESITSAVASLLDEDFVPHLNSSSCCGDNDNDNDTVVHFLFSLLQRFVGTDHGKKAFLKFGGVAKFSSRKVLLPSSSSSSFLLQQRALLLDFATKAVAVLHVATASLDVCSELTTFGGVTNVMLLLDKCLRQKQQVVVPSDSSENVDDDDDEQQQRPQRHVHSSSSASSSSSSSCTALHCLGIVQNVLREIKCSKSFWKSEKNIETLVRATVDPEMDEGVRASAMLVLVTNAGLCGREMERDKKRRECDDTTTTAAATTTASSSGVGGVAVKDSLSRCLSAAMTSMMMQSVFEER